MWTTRTFTDSKKFAISVGIHYAIEKGYPVEDPVDERDLGDDRGQQAGDEGDNARPG